MCTPTRLETSALITSNFLSTLAALPVGDLLAGSKKAGPMEVRHALEEFPLDLEAAAVLLRQTDERWIDEIATHARAATRHLFGREVHLYAPLCISSACDNRCRYCGIASDATQRDVRMTPSAIVDAVRYLADEGFHRIVLVAAESSDPATADDLCEALELCREVGPEIDVNAGAASEETYRRWLAAGAAGALCLQETYSPLDYAHHHVSGPKCGYEERLEAPDRAGSAGFRRLGIGVFLGLADPLADTLGLIAHARHLGSRQPGTHVSIFLSRAPGNYPGLDRAHRVDDETFVRIVGVLRLALPAAGIAISSRERSWLRHRLVSAGVTEMSVGQQSPPEIQVECQHDGGENLVRDGRNLYELTWDIQDVGYTVV